MKDILIRYDLWLIDVFFQPISDVGMYTIGVTPMWIGRAVVLISLGISLYLVSYIGIGGEVGVMAFSAVFILCATLLIIKSVLDERSSENTFHLGYANPARYYEMDRIIPVLTVVVCIVVGTALFGFSVFTLGVGVVLQTYFESCDVPPAPTKKVRKEMMAYAKARVKK